MSEIFHDKKRIIAALAQSPHGNLKEYLEVGIEAAQLDPDFFAHLLAWNHVKGSVRDSKVALPIIALKALDWPPHQIAEDATRIFADNALAHIADLRPREFKRAIEFGWDIGAPTRMLKRLTIRYLRDLEANRWAWEATALRHKQPIRWLYAQALIPVRQSESAIFGRFRAKRPIASSRSESHVVDRGEVPHRFRVFALLPSLSPIEIGAMIDKYKLPFLNVRGALGKKAAEPDVVMALMARMSPSELVTNMKWLKRVGVEKVPALRSMLEKALEKAGRAPKAKTRSFKISASLKTTKAAEVLEDGEDDVLAGKLRVLQEKQLQHVQDASGVEGDWLVLADKSGSMEKAMVTARMVAGTLSRLVKGKVYLVFFDTIPRPYDVTGKTLEEINAITATLTAQGGTSIGVGLQSLIERKLAVNGIAIVSDGCENSHRQPRYTNNYGPQFAETYPKYVKALGIIEPTVYFYQMETSFPAGTLAQHPLFMLEQQARLEIEDFLGSSKFAGIDIQTFDLRKKTVDYHSVAELVSTMRVGRFQLLDEINGVGLRKLDEVLEATKHECVLPKLQHAMA